jgi:hypothetical protein
MRLGMREWFFGLYLVANLAIILFSIWLWSRSMTAEAVFVGLWAPTLDLLYVMFVVTFKPVEHRAAVAPRSTERALETRAPLAAV